MTLDDCLGELGLHFLEENCQRTELVISEVVLCLQLFIDTTYEADADGLAVVVTNVRADFIEFAAFFYYAIALDDEVVTDLGPPLQAVYPVNDLGVHLPAWGSRAAMDCNVLNGFGFQ